MTTQKWNAAQYGTHADFVSKLGSSVLEILNPKENQKILDLGCGDGTLAQEILKSGAAVVGVDSSPSMIQSAKSKGIEAYVISGDSLTFEQEFDSVFSNAALHWITDYQAVANGVYRSLKPNGQFCG